jgi:HEAT repeat protein
MPRWSSRFVGAVDGLARRRPHREREGAQADIRALLEAGILSFVDLQAELVRGEGDMVPLACWVAGQLGRRETLPALRRLLVSPRTENRRAAVRAIGDFGDRRSAADVLAVAEADTDREARVMAANALGRLNAAAQAGSLLRLLADRGEDPRVRGAAAEALAMIGLPGASDALRGALHDDSAEVRFWSAYGLGEIGDRSAIDDLAALAAGDNSHTDDGRSVRGEAADAIRRMRRRVRQPG